MTNLSSQSLVEEIQVALAKAGPIEAVWDFYGFKDRIFAALEAVSSTPQAGSPSADTKLAEEGYVQAFYEVADMLGIPSQPISPKRVWEEQMRPALKEALRTQPAAASPGVVEALDYYADQLCEGWCDQSPDCAHFEDCGGCLARRTAWKARTQVATAPRFARRGGSGGY